MMSCVICRLGSQFGASRALVSIRPDCELSKEARRTLTNPRSDTHDYHYLCPPVSQLGLP
jgi:hypothetical protein